MDEIELNMLNEQLTQLNNYYDYLLDNRLEFINNKKSEIQSKIDSYQPPYPIATGNNITMRDHLINLINEINNNEEEYYQKEIVRTMNSIDTITQTIQDGNRN